MLSRAPVLEGGQVQYLQSELTKIRDAFDSCKMVLELLEARIAALE
jgi:hypothetical protein